MNTFRSIEELVKNQYKKGYEQERYIDNGYMNQ